MSDRVLEMIDEELSQVEAQMRVLGDKRDFLRALKRKAAMSGNGVGPSSAALTKPLTGGAVARPAIAGDGPSMNDLIIQFVSESEPNAVSRKEIVDYVLARKPTTSTDPSSMLYGYIAQLIRGRFLEKIGTGVTLGKTAWNPKRRHG